MKMQMEFLGAAGEVTGSCQLLRVIEHHIPFDLSADTAFATNAQRAQQ